MLGNFLSGAAGRIFSVSLPTVASALGTDIVGVSWALLSYQISSIGLALLFGRIGDMYGREKVYGIGYLVFVASTILCGLSQNISQLIFFRILEGVGGAMTQSNGRALASEAMPDNQASKAQGLMTTAFHSGFLLGPSIGGLIIDYVYWRGIFFVMVPVGALGAILTFWNMKKSKESRQRQEIDYLGATLLVASASSLILLLDHRAREILGPEMTALVSGIFAVSLIGFFFREARARSPIVNLALFKNRMFTFSSISLLVISTTHSLTGFILPFYLQGILHLSPSFMGVLFMSAPIFTVSLAPFSGHLADRIGPRIPATAGILMFGTAAVLGINLKTDSHWFFPALMLALSGMGSGLFNAPNHGAMMSSVPKEHRGFANGILQLGFNLGQIFGVSLGSFLMTLTFQLHTGRSSGTPSTEEPTAFVSALNYTYVTSLVFIVIGLFTSLMRGPKTNRAREQKLEAREELGIGS